jgi:adenylosuccinate lyase
MKEFQIAKLSGAVGTYSSQSMDVEKNVAKRLSLQVETLATQVIPRDRHAQLLHALALYAAGIERLAIELRHLQRTEVGEVVEGFTPGQKGSSAMPHKKNPISAENLTGLSRMMRSYSQVAQENVALWHERDISHSSTERMILGDSFILLDYMLSRMTTLLNGLYVDSERMKKNMNLSQGNLFSSHVLLALVEKGLSREEAYKIVQKLAHSLKPGQNLEEVAIKDAEVKKLLKPQEIKNIFQGKRHLEAIQKKLKSLGF